MSKKEVKLSPDTVKAVLFKVAGATQQETEVIVQHYNTDHECHAIVNYPLSYMQNNDIEWLGDYAFYNCVASDHN